MTTVAVGKNNDPSLAKTDLYRLGVDQIPAVNIQQASGTTYCADLLKTGMPRLVRDKPLTLRAQTPDAGVATTLFTFLAQRFQTSYTNLNCAMLLSIPNPVQTKTDANGVVIWATFNLQATGDPMPRASAPNCRITGQLVNGCTGTATISGQTCTLSFANNTVTLTCPLKHK